MKKLFVLACFISMASITSSCSNDDSSTPSKEEETKNELALTKGQGTYLKTLDDKGFFNLTLSGEDTKLELSLISKKIESVDLLEPNIESHKYILSTDQLLYTLSPESNLINKNEKLTIQSAELEIINQENKYSITGTIVDSNQLTYTVKFNDAIDIQPLYHTEYTLQNGWYWGDDEYKHPNIGQYMTFFVAGKTNNYGELDGDGYRVSLSLYDEKAPKAWEAKIPNKTYQASTTFDKGSFYIATSKDIEKEEPVYRYAYFEHRDSDKQINRKVYIRDNSFIKVIETPKGQEVRFNLELSDGTRHLGKYNGPIRQGDEATITSLKENRTVGNLDIGYLEFQGASPINGLQNNRWNIYLYNKDLKTDPDNYWAVGGSGEYMRIALYTELNQKTSIPSGTYNIGPEAPNMAGFGEGFEAGFDWGTWYFDLKNSDFKDAAPAKSGKIIVTNQNNVYTISVEFEDDRENIVTAKYTGKLIFKNNDKNKIFDIHSAKYNKNTKNFLEQYKQEKALRVLNRYLGQ